jgi:phosphonate transport system permease protein
LDERRSANLARFLGELVPYPVRERFSVHELFAWAVGLLRERGLEAAATTLAISVVAICLAGLIGGALCLPAARNFARAEAFLDNARPPRFWVRAVWAGFVHLTRTLLIFLRSIPEYVWAFLAISMIGPSAWPAVLALALHNAGILGKLGGEAIENLEERSLAGLRGLGASRAQVAVNGIFPAVLPRFLLYFFYRFETCVREATVLGMLGIGSLGYWIQDARARNQYDTLVFFVAIGVAIVLVGDLVSVVARRVVRNAA